MIGFLATLSTLDAPTHALVDVSVVDPVANAVRPHRTILFNSSKIVTIIEAAEANTEGLQRIEGGGKFVIPGLWDMHVHLMDERSLGLFPANGVTGVRVMFGAPHQLKWRENVREGKTLGPQMILGSPIVDGPKPIWPGSIAVSTPEEGREAVRKIKKDGYDFVKVYSLLSRVAFMAIAEESKVQGIPFAGHVPHSVGILEAQQAGQRSSEHVMGVSVECSDTPGHYHSEFDKASQEGRAKVGEVSTRLAPKIIGSYKPESERQLIEGLSGGTLWQCPTLVVLRNVANLDDPNYGKSEQLKYVNPFLRNQWDPAKDFRFKDRKKEDWERSRLNYKSSFGFTGRMIKGKARILAGTDCLNPYVYAGYSLHEELELLVQAGMTAAEALVSATSGPAEVLGVAHKQGKIEAGFEPTFVLLSANPLENIANTRKIFAVTQNGKTLDRAALDAVLAEREYK